MSQESMDKLAQDMAQRLLNSGEKQFFKQFNIKDSANEEIVVLVVQRKKPSAEREIIRETTKSYPVATQPKGTLCPMCSGTGRVDN